MPTKDEDYRDNVDPNLVLMRLGLRGRSMASCPTMSPQDGDFSVGSKIARVATECTTRDLSAAHLLIALYYCKKD